jgi:predicted dehydrogenase/uncharacterized membrane protein YbhN (UPF0104 family)
LALKLRGALLGAGNIALKSHAPQWARDPVLRERVEIVAVADLAPANLAAVRELLPDARPYADAAELLEHERIDFCDICTPPFTHRSLIERAARAGVHVLCEKPLAPTLADAEAIAAAVRAAGIVFTPCHQYRWSPQWQALRTLLPRIGRVTFAEYEVLRSAANEGNPHWQPTWRTEPALAGGGILVDHGAHIFYQLRSVLGTPRTVGATVGRHLHHGYGVEDTAEVALDYGGCEARIHLTWAARERAIRFRFVGEAGEIVGDDQSLTVRAARTETLRFDDGMSKNSSHAEWYVPLLREFTEAMQGRARDDEPLEEALFVARLTDRAYASSGRTLSLETGEPVVTASDRGVSARTGTARTPVLADLPGSSAGPVPTPVPPRRRRLAIALRVGGGLALVAMAWFLLRRIDWPGFWNAIGTSDPRWLALAAALNLVALGFAAMRWLALLRPLSPLSRWRDAFKALIVGLTVSAVVPARGGEVARMAWLHKRTGLSRIAILSSIGLDQLLNVAGLMLGLALMPWFVGIPPWLRVSAQVALFAFAAFAILILVLRPRQPVPAAEVEGPATPAGLLARVRHGLTAARSARSLGGSLAASLTVWIIELIVMRVALHAVDIDLPMSETLVVLAAVNLMLVFPIAPANLGSFEIGATLGLRGFGVANERALAFAICYHALQIVPIAVLGLLIVGSEGLRGAVAEVGAGG